MRFSCKRAERSIGGRSLYYLVLRRGRKARPGERINGCSCAQLTKEASDWQLRSASRDNAGCSCDNYFILFKFKYINNNLRIYNLI